MPDARPVTVMTLGVRYDELAPLCGGPRGVGDWATTPTDRPTETGRAATSPDAGCALQGGFQISSLHSAAQAQCAVCSMMHAWTTVAADGQGEREARFGYTVPRVLCMRFATSRQACLPCGTQYSVAILPRTTTMFNVGNPCQILYLWSRGLATSTCDVLELYVLTE